MGNNGKALSRQGRKGKDTTHGGQFLTTVTAHDACFTEQGLDSRIAGSNSPRM